jgi:hypothetical protein
MMLFCWVDWGKWQAESSIALETWEKQQAVTGLG